MKYLVTHDTKRGTAILTGISEDRKDTGFSTELTMQQAEDISFALQVFLYEMDIAKERQNETDIPEGNATAD